MKFSSRFTAVAVSSALAVAGFATAAHATPVVYDGSNVQFGDTVASDFRTDAFALGDVNVSNAWLGDNPQHDANNSNWDGRGYFGIKDPVTHEYVYYAGIDANDSSCMFDIVDADPVITCDAEELVTGIFVHPEIRYFAESGAQRLVWVIDNQTGAEFAADVITTDKSECDGDGFAHVSSGAEGGSNVDASTSNWMVQRPADGYADECGVEVSVWQSIDATVTGHASLSSDLDRNDFNYMWNIPSGKTNALAFFYANWWIDDQNDSSGNTFISNRDFQFGFAQVATDSSFQTWSDRYAVGLTADKVIDVVNWNASYGQEPALAKTGVDASGIAIAGFGLLVAGVAVAIRRRARA